MNERKGSILVFARTQSRVDRIAEKLKDGAVKATRIHGGRTQSQRRQAIDHFREGHYRVLIATDIAARGLDIHHIAHVINYDLPRNPEDYIHRVGRTARDGAEGSALCLLTPEDRGLWESIVRLMGVKRESIPQKPSRFGIPAPQVSHAPSYRPSFNKQDRGRGSQGERRGFQPKPFAKREGHRKINTSPSARPHQRSGSWSGHSERDKSQGNTFIYHGPKEGAVHQPSKSDWSQKLAGFRKKIDSKFRGDSRPSGQDRPFSREGSSRLGQGPSRDHASRSFGNETQPRGSFKRPGGSHDSERKFQGARKPFGFGREKPRGDHFRNTKGPSHSHRQPS